VAIRTLLLVWLVIWETTTLLIVKLPPCCITNRKMHVTFIIYIFYLFIITHTHTHTLCHTNNSHRHETEQRNAIQRQLGNVGIGYLSVSSV
jgi:hypothetical protein